MAKINCNDGCLDNYAGTCVKYTGIQINNPLIVQNETLNNIVNILVSAINSVPGATDVYVGTPIDSSSLDNTYLNTAFPNALVGFAVHYTNIIGNPGQIFRICKYDATGLWAYFSGVKIPS